MVYTAMMPTMAIAMVAGVSLEEPAAIGIQRERSKGRVPDMEATPGRFQGPKMSQILSAVATKLSPSPPNISFTPPNVRKAPASRAQSVPPRTPASTAMVRIMPGFHPESWRSRIAQVVKMAPSVICPSMPIFQSPTVNVTRSPEVARRSGTHETRTLDATSQEPTAPSAMYL